MIPGWERGEKFTDQLYLPSPGAKTRLRDSLGLPSLTRGPTASPAPGVTPALLHPPEHTPGLKPKERAKCPEFLREERAENPKLTIPLRHLVGGLSATKHSISNNNRAAAAFSPQCTSADNPQCLALHTLARKLEDTGAPYSSYTWPRPLTSAQLSRDWRSAIGRSGELGRKAWAGAWVPGEMAMAAAASRGVGAKLGLREIRIHLCQRSPGSQGVR